MGELQSILSQTILEEMERSEQEYMYDRMTAIQSRPNNPEGVEIRRFGYAMCLYSKTMPWPAFNTVKGLCSSDRESLDSILDFYQSRNRTPLFEIVPSRADQKLLQALSTRGFYQSGFHTSLYIAPSAMESEAPASIIIKELQEDQVEEYARIHCRGTGLPDDGIPHVAANNKALFNRPGWKFFMAYSGMEAAAAGVMYVENGLASLTFAATLPEYRNQGFQQALLKRRIQEAKRMNCRLAVSQCAFLSQSHRNMERVGMKIGYVRASWTK